MSIFIFLSLFASLFFINPKASAYAENRPGNNFIFEESFFHGLIEEGAQPKSLQDWLSITQIDMVEREYHISWKDDKKIDGFGSAFQAPNRKQNFRTYFLEDGVLITIKEENDKNKFWELKLELLAYGYSNELNQVHNPNLKVNGNKIEYTRDGFTEWYINDERGIEQGFTLFEPPTKSTKNSSNTIEFRIGIRGNLNPIRNVLNDEIDFFLHTEHMPNVEVLNYGKLFAFDATGKPLSANLELLENNSDQYPYIINLIINIENAQYPITIDPLASTPDWSIESDQENANLGATVSTAGDVNGDGFDDVIIGSKNYDGGQTDEGKVFLYFGSENGLKSTPDWSFESNNAYAYLGGSVSSAGDINGDGYDDVLIGAERYDRYFSDEGRVYLFLGSANGLSSNPDWVAEGGQAEAYFGKAVSLAGDINGDGYGDIIVGAPGYDSSISNVGRVYVYFGSEAGLSTTYDWSVEGNQAEAEFGFSVGGAGDVNGDGYDDVVVGQPYYSNEFIEEGSVYVYYGSDIGLSSIYDWQFENSTILANLGTSVNTAGDVNGDGYSDIIVGAPRFSTETWPSKNFLGRVYSFYGSSSGLPTIPSWFFTGTVSDSQFGKSVDSAGDIDNDGYGDVIIGQPMRLPGYRERVFLFNGSDSGLDNTADWTGEINQDNAYFGYSVASAGDVNNDSYSDIIIGAPALNGGSAYLYQGLHILPPIADAGPDAEAYTNSLVTLDGSASSDPEGDYPLSYEWWQTSGTIVTLNDSTSVNPSFISPGDPEELTFSLRVTDSYGLSSTIDEVVVSINNQAPVADAGLDQPVVVNTLVSLDGSASYDPDDDTPLSYQWSQTGGTSVTLEGAETANPTFTAPVDPDTLTFTLIVTDSLDLTSESDTVTTFVSNPPSADAGEDQSVDTLELVTLDGSASSDPDGDTPLSYQWTQIDGTSVSLTDSDTVNPTFTAPDDPDTLTFSLVVTDSLGLGSEPDTMTVTVNNQQPVAYAGTDQSVDTLKLVALDGSASNDPDGDTPLSYQWTQTDGTVVTLMDDDTVNPTFNAPGDPDTLTFSLVVTDSFGFGSEEDTVTIIINNQEPVTNAGPDQAVDILDLVTLDGSTSYDPDGDMPLSYQWTQTEGTSVSITDADTANPSFTAPSNPDTLKFSLVVIDSLGLSDPSPDTIRVTVSDNTPKLIYLPLILRGDLPPAAFSKINPANGAQDQSVTPTIAWEFTTPVTRFEYCYDTTNDNTCLNWINNGTSTSVLLPSLSSDTIYFWQVRAWNNNAGPIYANGSKSAFWSFRTEQPIPPDPIINGGFESGGVAWEQVSYLGFPLIYNKSNEELPVLPHSGSWLAWLGGYPEEISLISQNITIPVGRSILHYWIYVASEDLCGYDVFGIMVNNGEDIVESQWLCEENSTFGWVHRTVDLSAYENTNQTLEFLVGLDGSLNSHVFLDDISLETTFLNTGNDNKMKKDGNEDAINDSYLIDELDSFKMKEEYPVNIQERSLKERNHLFQKILLLKDELLNPIK